MTTMATTRGADGLERRFFTVDDVDRMIEAGVLSREDRFELIRGEIVPMPSQLSPHTQMKSQIARWLGARLDSSWRIGNDITVRLNDGGLFDPDVLVWRPVKGRIYIPIAQAALAIELADTTLPADLKIKAPDYGRAGLPALWVVDLNGRVTHVFSGPNADGWAEERIVSFETPIPVALAAGEAITLAALED